MNNHFLFIFMDGVGLGSSDPAINPFARAVMPSFGNFLEGKKLVASDSPSVGKKYSLSGIDAMLGIPGMPQSATGQASLLSGLNVPKLIGGHYGPKPNDAITALLSRENLFQKLSSAGKSVCLLNAYPQRFFDSINSGRRLLSAIPYAVDAAGVPLKNTDDYYSGKALSADLTGKGWRDRLNMQDAPLYTPVEAGKKMATLAAMYDFSFFEYWLSDYAGHAQDMDAACNLLTEFDEMFRGLLMQWDLQENLIFITSDHGNMEDLSTHRHTQNPVPALVVGEGKTHYSFAQTLHSLVDVTPAILKYFGLVDEMTG
jgi:hypothetical protein